MKGRLRRALLLELAPCEVWGEQDSNLRSCEAADLQSAPVGHLGISPVPIHGANGRIRTPDLLITNQLLYQLSYTSVLGGNNRARTYDPLLVRQVLSQLSYAPE